MKKASYTVKEWFANKIANEVQMNIQSCNVFAILKETEKAVYGMLDLGYTDSGRARRKTTWIPKSVLVERENGSETLEIADYEEAVERFEHEKSLYV